MWLYTEESWFRRDSELKSVFHGSLLLACSMVYNMVWKGLIKVPYTTARCSFWVACTISLMTESDCLLQALRLAILRCRPCSSHCVPSQALYIPSPGIEIQHHPLVLEMTQLELVRNTILLHSNSREISILVYFSFLIGALICILSPGSQEQSLLSSWTKVHAHHAHHAPYNGPPPCRACVIKLGFLLKIVRNDALSQEFLFLPSVMLKPCMSVNASF